MDCGLVLCNTQNAYYKAYKVMFLNKFPLRGFSTTMDDKIVVDVIQVIIEKCNTSTKVRKEVLKYIQVDENTVGGLEF